ncbi:hypothetical protein [Actinomyces bouchesdurhonensis]|uniref:hypothetical protein n=1 Tax=Actinomyces bouchesdurhonensis TaxID=1852361 RepID=UPI00093CA569|nr:hypothetical protein [Actinomyces bouchesdurhonensis]
MSVALTVLFVLLALTLIAGGLYLFASGLAARADACRPPLGLRLFMDAPASIPFVFVLSGAIVEAGLWLVARGAGKAALR